MSSKSGSSAVMNTGHSSAKPQTKPTTAISAPHPLLKSSRGRHLWTDQPTMILDDKKRPAALDDDPDVVAISRTRQRTSSVTSIETIRLRVKAKVADALRKPKPPLAEAPMVKRSTRKRTYSATSPEADEDDSGALQTGPRVRQRKDSNSTASSALTSVDDQNKGEEKAGMPIGASSALKKLRERFPPAQADVANAPREPRASLSAGSASSAENASVAFPSMRVFGTGTTRLKPTTSVSDPLAQPLQSLSTNTESKRVPTRLPIPGARLNQFNCYELSAAEFELAITFPSTSRSNFEVWDQEDELFLVGPMSLHLTLKNPAKWTAVPVSHPDVQILEIRCATKVLVDAPAAPYCTAAAAEANRFAVRYAGAKTRSVTGQALTLDPKCGIATDTVWLRTYAALPAHTDEPSAAASAAANAGRRGWEMQFFVPIATRLFEKRETRAFQVEALISVSGETLAAEVATMSVSHLMREREMVVRR